MKSKSTFIRHKITPCFLMLLVLFHSVGCKYYKVDSVETQEFVNILNMGEIHKYFVVHSGNVLYSLSKIEADASAISGNLQAAQEDVYYTEERKNRIKNNEKNIVNEVHIYLKKETDQISPGYVEFPLTDIDEIRIIDRNTGKEIAVYALVTVGAIAIVSAIVALTKSSCPYVYVNNGELFVFEGETFGGAIAKNLEREDYMPLPSIKASDGTYSIRISNELKERQYTNLLELVVVEHASEQDVLLDKSGNPQLIGNISKPFLANSSSGEDLLAVLDKKDAKVHLFNDHDYSKNEVLMKFKKPENALHAKLVIKGKNTLWFDYLFGEFLEIFGGYYADWMQKQAETSTDDRMQNIIDNDFPLFISIKKNGKWQLVDYLLTVGPLAPREFVVPVEISDIPGDEIEIKLHTGFMFWELDYAGVDFSENTDLKKRVIKPYLAVGTGSIDWKAALENADEEYMVQENTGDVTEILFEVPVSLQEQPHTTFLKTQGYYELIRDFEGLPGLVQLKKFKTPGHFSDFSRERYLNVVNIEYGLASN